MGGSNLSRKLEGGGENFEFPGAPEIRPLSTEIPLENRQFGGQKSRSSRRNFRGEFPPPLSGDRYVLTPPLSRSPTHGATKPTRERKISQKFPKNLFRLFLTSNPKNLLRLFFRNNLARQKITSKNKNNLARLFVCLF